MLPAKHFFNPEFFLLLILELPVERRTFDARRIVSEPAVSRKIMKHCPVCRTIYTDRTLRFCLQDGAELAEEAKQSTVETLAFHIPVTSGRIAANEDDSFALQSVLMPPDERSQNWPATNRATLPNVAMPAVSPVAPAPAGRRKTYLVWLAVIPALGFLSVAGLGGWAYYEKNYRASATVPEAIRPQMTEKTSATEAPARETNPDVAISENDSPAPAAGADELKKEVADAVEAWRRSVEARNLPAFLSNYAEKVDFYEMESAGLAQIRADTQKILRNLKKSRSD
jgi:hypothetical protein